MVFAFEINPATFPGAKVASVGNMVSFLIPFLLFLLLFVMIFYLGWGAFSWIMASGDKEKLDNARKKITYAITGFIIVALAYILTRIIGYILRIDFFL